MSRVDPNKDSKREYHAIRHALYVAYLQAQPKGGTILTKALKALDQHEAQAKHYGVEKS